MNLSKLLILATEFEISNHDYGYKKGYCIKSKRANLVAYVNIDLDRIDYSLIENDCLEINMEILLRLKEFCELLLKIGKYISDEENLIF